MLVTRGLGRKSTEDSLLASFGFGRVATAVAEVHGKVIRRWRSRIRRTDLEDLPITSRKEFLRRVEAALKALATDTRPAVRRRASEAREGLLKADSIKRRSLLRLNFEVVLNQLEVISWALDAFEEQRNRRRRDDEEVLVLLSAARQRGWL